MGTVWDRSSDDELLAAARADPLAFGAFYRRHEERMLAFFLGRVGDAEVAADLTAETFAAGESRPAPGTAWECPKLERRLTTAVLWSRLPESSSAGCGRSPRGGRRDP